jgi:hypothetical protein
MKLKSWLFIGPDSASFPAKDLSTRMVWLVPATVLLLASVTTQTLEAQTMTIDFDTDPDGLPVPHGTIVNSIYQAQGVLFEHVGPGAACGDGPEVFASQNCLLQGAPSPPNVVTLCGPDTRSDISEDGFGMIRANFERSAEQVCIDVVPVRNDAAGVLRAFDADGHIIAEATSKPGASGSVCITAPDIRSVVFSGNGDQYAWFDNLTVDFLPSPVTSFHRGDANVSGTIDIADAIFVLSYLFAKGAMPLCLDATDTNDDGRVNISDAIMLLRYVFGGQALPAPFGECGVDPTEDSLDCSSFAPCS